jgi:hypothetical protein
MRATLFMATLTKSLKETLKYFFKSKALVFLSTDKAQGLTELKIVASVT